MLTGHDGGGGDACVHHLTYSPRSEREAAWRIILIQFFSLFLIQFQECQNLLEENRRLAHGNGSPNDNVDDMLMPSSTNGGTVEETVLQTQIETLQWQLNQVKPFIKTLYSNDDDDDDGDGDSPLDYAKNCVRMCD